MTTLLFADHVDGDLSIGTAKAPTAALQFGQPVHVLVAGTDVRTAVESASKLSGVKKVLVADDPRYAHTLAEQVATLIVSLAGSYDAIVSPLRGVWPQGWGCRVGVAGPARPRHLSQHDDGRKAAPCKLQGFRPQRLRTVIS